MALADDISEKLARDAFEQAEATGDDRLIEDLSHLLGTTSPSLQEGFDANIRYLKAEARARDFMQTRLGGS